MITDREIQELFARKATEMNISREIPSDLLNKARRRHVLTVLAASIVVVGVAASAWVGTRSLLASDRALPPAGENDDATVGQEDPSGWPEDVSGWAKPTAATLVGLWKRTYVDGYEDKDPTPLELRLRSNGKMAFDDAGLVDSLPAVSGSYELSKGKVSFVNGGGDACPAGDTWTWRVRLSEDGRMWIVHTEPGTGNCYHAIQTEWLFSRSE